MPEVAVAKPSELNSPQKFTHAVYNEARRQGLGDMGARILTAHMSISTGWGAKVHNYILAGVKASPTRLCSSGASDPGYNYVCLQTWECVKGAGYPYASCAPGTGRVDVRHPFRAYGSLAEGVAGVLRMLKSSRYYQTYTYLKSGDTRYFRQLRADGWFTGSGETFHQSGMRRLVTISKYLNLPPPVVAGGGVMGVALLVGGYFLAKRYL